MTKFDDAVTEETTKYDNAVTEVMRDKTALNARLNYLNVLGTNPDAVAEAQRIARRTGVPVDTALNVPEVKKQDAMAQMDFDQLAQVSPATAKVLADAQKARIAFDDVENMGVFETSLNSLKRGVLAFKSIWPTLQAINHAEGIAVFREIDARLDQGENPKEVLSDYGDVGLASLPWQTSEQALAGYQKIKADRLLSLQNSLKHDVSNLATLAQSRGYYPSPASTERMMHAQTLGDALSEFAAHPILNLASIGPESLIQLIPGLLLAIPAGLVTGGMGAAGVMGANSFVMDYINSFHEALQAKGVNLTDKQAIRDAFNNPEILADLYRQATRHASVVAGFDTFSAGLASKTLLTKAVVERFGEHTLKKELANIAVQLPVQATLGGAGEVLGELNAGQSLQPGQILGEMVGELFGTPFEVISVSAQRVQENIEKAQRAQSDAQVLSELNQAAKASKVLSRDAVTFEQFIADAAQDAPVDHVFIDANTLMQSGVAHEVAAVSPAVAEQFTQALEIGGTIAIPIEEYAARIAPTSLSEPLLDHIRTEPEGFSRAEANAYMQSENEQLQYEIANALTEKQNDNAFQHSVDEVRTHLKAQLDEAGRFKTEVNDLYAHFMGQFYAVQAARMGVMPEALYSQFPLNIRAENIINHSAFTQATKEIEIALQNVRQDKKYTGSHDIASVDEAEIEEAKRFGLNIKDFKHTIDGSAINHIFKNHGNAKVEISRGQMAVTEEDIKLIPMVLAQPDKIIYGLKNKIGRDMIVYLKKMSDGTTVYLEEVRTGKKTLATQSMRRYVRTTHATSILKSLYPTPETLPETASLISVVDHPAPRNHFVGDELFKQSLASQPSKGWKHEPTAADVSALWRKQGEYQAVFWTDINGKLAQDVPDIAGYSHSIDKSRIDHIRSKHGVAKRENARGQIAVTDSDIFRIPEIVTKYDAIVDNIAIKDEQSNQKLRGVIYVKQYQDATVVYTEVVSRKRQNLRGATMWKYPPTTDAQTAITRSVSSPTSETLEGMNEIVTEGESIHNPIFQWGSRNAKGIFNPDTLTISLLKNADLSTFLHESGHFFLEVLNDLAMRENAPADVQADMAIVLKYFGIQDLATWNAMSIDEKRPFHEQFARGFERYLFEGKAPSIEMQGIFQRFRAWLLAVYKKIAALNVQLSDDVRGVFDRMLASTAEIQLAEQSRSMMPLFENAEQAGLSQIEFQDYQRLGVDATNEAIEVLQTKGLRDMQWLHHARGRELARLQKMVKSRRKAVKEEVAAEVLQQPVYQAWKFLKNKKENGQPAGKLSLQSMLDLYAIGSDQYAKFDWKRLRDQKMVATNGIHPDLVAERFGFSSGDELVRELVRAEAPAQVIEQQTDTRMLERYGELSLETLQREADKAIHNDVRAKMVATEMNALAKAVGKKRVLANAAKMYAQQMIDRLKIRSIKPAQYVSAQMRAANAAQAAMKKSELAIAAAEKRNQLIQHYAAKAAYAAQDEIESSVRYLNKFNRDVKGLDIDYREQIEALLERFDLSKASLQKIDQRKTLVNWIESQREIGLEPDIPESLKNEAYRQSYKEMTLEDFRGLVDTVKQIEHLGRLKKRLLTARDQREFEAIRDELVESVYANGQNRKANLRTPTTNSGRFLNAVKAFGAAHIKAATWAHIIDGNKDGGPMWEYFIRSANARATQEASMRAQATQKLMGVMEPVLKLGKMGGKGTYFTSIQRSLNRESVFALALNMGNAGNMQRLLDGEGWKLQEIMPVLQTLTATEWQAVQAIWDHFESYRPMIAEKERRVFGKEPNWIEPQALNIETADGQTISLKGGYYPIQYDPVASIRAEEHVDAQSAKDAMFGAYNATTTRRSFTKDRAKKVMGRPLLLTTSGLYKGLNEIIHDLSWHEWLIDVNRLLRSEKIDKAIRETYGAHVVNQFKTWRDDIASEMSNTNHAVESMLKLIRQNVAVSGLGYNLLSALQQPIGLTQSIVRVGLPWVIKGVGQYLKNVYFVLGRKERIAISGKNAAGKSTLLKAIGNKAIFKIGDWHLPGLEQIGYLDQHYANLQPELSVIEQVQALRADWSEMDVRRHLNDFLFRSNQEVMQIAAHLSGSEKARASLSMIAAKTPKLLILDEITNNLDLETQAHVIQVLKAYPGTMMIVLIQKIF